MKRPVEQLDPDRLARDCRFVAEAWRRFPDAPPPDQAVDEPAIENVLEAPEPCLRRYRQLQSVHILWQDLTGAFDIAETGRAVSALARSCLELALRAAEEKVRASCGDLLDADDRPLRLAVLGLGKLGGDELNFNSDIDLVFAYRGEADSTGLRKLPAARYHQMVARELIRLLDPMTEHGRVWIVDTRLRPFGDAGGLVWSVGAMEQYFLNEGRTWERYAWLKARPVAGDHAVGEHLLKALQPFIFRRYLDYGIFDSLRELHERIDADSRASGRTDIKRGAGGIRAAEFLIQSQQILRGGRDRLLRVTGFLPALEACAALGLLDAEAAGGLQQAYSYLRIVENRLQAMTGRQGHHLPDAGEQLDCLAGLLGLPDRGALSDEVEHYRRIIEARFADRFRPPEQHSTSGADLWPPRPDLAERLQQIGYEDAEQAAEALVSLERRLSRRPLSAEGQRRLERLIPPLLEQTVKQPEAGHLLPEILQLIDQISRRSAYLSLLHERPETLARLIRIFSASARVSTWITRAPQLLDDLLDPIHGLDLPALPAADPDEPEDSLNALGHWRQAGFLRTALAELDGRISAVEAAERLSLIAETIIDQVLGLIGSAEDRIAVIGYGNLGARLLHYESDLDLVFLHDQDPAPLRPAQRLISLMQMPLPGGRLFEIDTRLRPNGRAGLLVSRIDTFADYQKQQAWTWEHQALIRARWVAGEDGLQSHFEQVRKAVLCRPRASEEVCRDLAQMRSRQRRERKESPIKALLTDIQYIAEAGVLCHAAEHQDLIESRRIDAQLALLADTGWLTPSTAEQLSSAWSALIGQRHLHWLERQSREDNLDGVEPVVAEIWQKIF